MLLHAAARGSLMSTTAFHSVCCCRGTSGMQNCGRLCSGGGSWCASASRGVPSLAPRVATSSPFRSALCVLNAQLVRNFETEGFQMLHGRPYTGASAYFWHNGRRSAQNVDSKAGGLVKGLSAHRSSSTHGRRNWMVISNSMTASPARGCFRPGQTTWPKTTPSSQTRQRTASFMPRWIARTSLVASRLTRGQCST